MRILQRLRVPRQKFNFQRGIFRLWLTITGTSVVNLSLSFYNISLPLRAPFKSFMVNCKSIFQPNIPQKHKSQLTEIRRKHYMKFIVLGDKAYWARDNQMYECAVENGEIDKSKAVPLDAHSLTDTQFNQLLSFLDNTT